MPKEPKLKITLLDTRARLEARIGAMRDSQGTVDDIGVAESYDNSGDSAIGDLASPMLQKELDMAMLEKHREHLAQVNSALKRIDEGSYGVCARCHQKISEARLEAIPETAFCRDCELDVEAEA